MSSRYDGYYWDTTIAWAEFDMHVHKSGSVWTEQPPRTLVNEREPKPAYTLGPSLPGVSSVASTDHAHIAVLGDCLPLFTGSSHPHIRSAARRTRSVLPLLAVCQRAARCANAARFFTPKAARSTRTAFSYHLLLPRAVFYDFCATRVLPRLDTPPPGATSPATQPELSNQQPPSNRFGHNL